MNKNNLQELNEDDLKDVSGGGRSGGGRRSGEAAGQSDGWPYFLTDENPPRKISWNYYYDEVPYEGIGGKWYYPGDPGYEYFTGP